VVLLRLDRSPLEEARTKIDAKGGFSFDLQDPVHPHIVRVTHQGVNYDKRITAGGAISIDVFDVTAKAQGVTGIIEIIRAGTLGSALHISDMIQIRNESNPPVTQAGERSFEVYLPAKATITSVLATGPEKNILASISATPIPGEPGHYAVSFPVLPGATKFAFNYDLPYNGHATIRAKSIYPFQQIAVMIPPTMTFTARSSAFRALPVGTDRYRVETIENVKAGTGLEFEVSGAGAPPAMSRQGQISANAPATAAPGPAIAAETSRVPNTASIADPARKRAAHSSAAWWWVLGAVGLGPIVSVYLVWRRQRLHVSATTSIAQPHPLHSAAYLVDALKEGLFQLESDHMLGIICGEDYTSAKGALEGTIRWALTRAQNRKAQAEAQ
jgi:hypothetical protein